MLSTLFQCRHCGGFYGFRSRPKNLTDKLLPLLLLRKVRCGNCCRRSVQTIFVQIRERHVSKSARSAAA